MENGKISLNIRKLKKQVKGITLIALVVTIIVLLILAGIALNLTIGQNGIFSRAQTAANTWRNAETNEQLALGELGNWIGNYLGENGNGGSQGGGSGTGGQYNTATTVADAKEQNKPFEKNTPIDDSSTPANSVVVPAGFKIAQDSATAVEDGIVIEDSDGNQFVWIPVSVLDEEGKKTPIYTSAGPIEIDYTRTAYSTQVATGETDEGTNSEKIKYSSYYFTEAMPSDELQSVNDNGGYYIGRFEAGDKESTEAETMRASGASQTNTITIKRGQVPYNRITQANAKTKAEEMASVQKYGEAFTRLVSSYAWDTAIDFIQKAKSTQSTYGNSSPEGNYSDTDYGDGLIRTGQTTPVSNIYDMGGNLWEYTTESYSRENFHYVRRGGCYINNYGVSPAGHRSYGSGPADSSIGFRTTLYCSTES